jgi:predicted nucleotidyltransferase
MSVKLLRSVGDDSLNRILEGIVRLFELTFPDRIRAYYLVGSVAAGNAVLTSDLDVVVVFKDEFDPNEEAKAKALAEGCQFISYVPVDFALYTETRLRAHNYGGGFALTRKLIYGAAPDLEIPLPPLAVYTENLMNGTHRVIHSFRDEQRLNLSYPDPDGEFYGYDRLVRVADGTERLGLKGALSCACMISSSLLALQAKLVVSGKRESISAFAEKIGGAWASYLTNFYQIVREQCHYIIPDNKIVRQQLRASCARLLDFERYFLSFYDHYKSPQSRKKPLPCL